MKGENEKKRERHPQKQWPAGASTGGTVALTCHGVLWADRAQGRNITRMKDCIQQDKGRRGSAEATERFKKKGLRCRALQGP